MKIIYILLVLLVMFGRLSAVPANPRPVEKTQPDGTKITVCLKGDERTHWMESLNGHTLMYNNHREIVFAVHDKYGNLTSSDILYRGELSSNYSSSEQKQIQNIPVKLCYSKEQVSAMQQIRQIVDGAEKNAERNADSPNRAQGNILGTHKVLVILAEFTNKTFTYSLTDFQNLMNQVGYTAGGNTGSVRDFYRENSYGKMDIEVSVAGPISSDNSTSYYALNESRWRAWAKEVATKADELVDYSEFANNGELPNFHIIFAGYGDENIADGKQLWSHKSSFIDSLVADGVYVGKNYSCSPELQGSSGNNMTYIGVICHELCHSFGAPDYYDTDYKSWFSEEYIGTGYWDLMASGSWSNDGKTPSHVNMWQKILFGWVKPIELRDSSSVVNMPASTDSAHAYWIKVGNNGERYVLENRQQKKFDSCVPGHGLLIYHIHKNALLGECNNTSSPQEVYPVCANSVSDMPNTDTASYGAINSTGCPFPGTGNNKSFGGETTPAMFAWFNLGGISVMGKDITNITEDTIAKTVSFDFMGGGKRPEEPLPCKDSITSFPFIWSFEDITPCYNFNVFEAVAEKNVIGVFAEGEMLPGSNEVSARTGSFAWVFSSYNNSEDYNQYMISPCIAAPADRTLMIEYWYKKLGGGGSSIESFRVGYSSTDTNIANFTWTSNRTNAANNWLRDTLTIPAGTKYIAVNYNSSNEFHLLIDDIRVDVSPLLSSNEILNNTEMSVKVYPNPTSGKFNVVVNEPMLVEVFNGNGILVEMKRIDGEQEFNLRKRALYLVRVTDGKGRVSIKKLIVK